jgi:hypothetical protein
MHTIKVKGGKVAQISIVKKADFLNSITSIAIQIQLGHTLAQILTN